MRTQSLTIAISLWALTFGAGVAIRAAADQVTDIAMVPRLTIAGTPGSTNQIQYCTDVKQPNWRLLTNVVVLASNYWFVDVTASPASRRFYRVLGTAPAGMVLVPAGSFTMGDSFGDGYSDSRPLHTVYVSDFYMDRYLVTSNLWHTVTAWNGGSGYSYDNPGSGSGDNYPVQAVDWYDVVKWCNARSQMEGLTPCYYSDSALTAVYKTGQVAPYVKWDASGYRLPSEAEWEKAARGGLAGLRYPWGNSISCTNANYGDCVGGATPVGSYAPNALGLYDMAGNVMEWCWDWYDDTYYSWSPATDPRGPASSPYGDRVLRSFCWDMPAFAISDRDAYHDVDCDPAAAYGSNGFRCARGF